MSVVILRGDAAHLPLPDESVDLVVTSPPYFGLRSYTDGGEAYGGQIGAEYTPWLYLEALWDCTREWMRVLKPSGSIFVVIGDKYSTYTGANWGNGRSLDGHRGQRKVPDGGPVNAPEVYGIPFKSLMGLPWRYALGCIDAGSALDSAEVVKLLLRDVALGVISLAEAEQAADELAALPGAGLGLTLRRDIVWHKANGMPESCSDRCRTSHEYLFHFVKQPRYFSAVREILEPHDAPGRRAGSSAFRARNASQPRTATGAYEGQNPLGRLPGSVWEIASAPLVVPAHLGIDHFAAYPPELCRRVILGWSPAGICTACGEGRRPVVTGGRNGDGSKPHKAAQRVSSFDWAAWKESVPHSITGYACACPDASAPTRPAVVVDPFGGTGTTSLVADVLGRTGITVDRSADYCRLARWRTSDPGERARALGVPKPPPVPEGQMSIFDVEAS